MRKLFLLLFLATSASAQTWIFAVAGGYLLGTVHPDGTITFDFREIARSDIPADVVAQYSTEGVDWCFGENKDLSPRTSAPCASADVPTGPIRD